MLPRLPRQLRLICPKHVRPSPYSLDAVRTLKIMNFFCSFWCVCCPLGRLHEAQSHSRANLLGNLLCAVVNLLNGTGGLTSLSALLTQILAALGR
jgi:hypothetical protein